MRLPDLQSPLAKAPPWINMQVDKVDVDFQSRHSIMYPSDDGTLSSIRSLFSNLKARPTSLKFPLSPNGVIGHICPIQEHFCGKNQKS